MLRILLVLGCVAVGLWYARRGPFYALLLYLWIAYFRPEHWVWGDGAFIRDLRLSLVVGTILMLSVLFSKERDRFRLSSGLIILLLFVAQAGLATFLSPFGP